MVGVKNLYLICRALQCQLYIARKETMNRKKKLNKIFNSRIKKMNAKKAPKNKEVYISKAERAKLEAAQENSN